MTYDLIQFDFLATRRLIVDERPMFGYKREVVSTDLSSREKAYISLDRNFHFGFLSASLFIAGFSRDTRGSGYKYANSGIDTMKIIVTALVTVVGILKHVSESYRNNNDNNNYGMLHLTYNKIRLIVLTFN